jgi:protein-S-isoprenylcysteine O-methyltransferase Ste14
MNLDDNGYPRELPPTWLRIALIAQVALHLLLPGKELWRDPWRWIAVAPLLLGVLLLLWSGKLFNRSGAGIRPFTRSLRVVTDGPYRITRNPMYLGMVLVLAAVAIFCGEVTPWFVVPAFVLVIDRRFVAREEQFMAEIHGEAYAAYRERVRRWL